MPHGMAKKKRKSYSSRPDVYVYKDLLALDNLQAGTNLRVLSICDQREKSHKCVKKMTLA